jgi:hypothetical protein
MGRWSKSTSASVASRIAKEATAPQMLSMTAYQEEHLTDDDALHCMSPEAYWCWIETMQEHHSIDMETIWDV